MTVKQKHPENVHREKQLMNALLDEVVKLWKSEKEPELKKVSEKMNLSQAKIRKLLITAGERDGQSYFLSSKADTILKLWREGKNVKEICAATGLSYTSVQGYLPHQSVYGLDKKRTE